MVGRSPKILQASDPNWIPLNKAETAAVREAGTPGYWLNEKFYATSLPEEGVGPPDSFLQRITSRKFLLALAAMLVTFSALLTGQIDGVACVTSIWGIVTTYSATQAHIDASKAASNGNQ